MDKKWGWGFVAMWLLMVLLQFTWIGFVIWAIVHFVRKFW